MKPEDFFSGGCDSSEIKIPYIRAVDLTYGIRPSSET